MKMYEDYRNEFRIRFKKYSDQEVIDAFNSQVENQGSIGVKMAYLGVIKENLIKRSIDFSAVGDEKVMSYAHCVILKERKMVRVIDLSIGEIELLFQKWVETCRPGIAVDLPYVKGVYKETDKIHIASNIIGYGIQMALSIKDVVLRELNY